MTKLEKILKAFAVSELEASVFLAVLALGEASAVQVATQAELNRITTYQALKRLEERGMIVRRAYRRKKVKVFAASSYETLLEKLQDRARVAVEDASDFLEMKSEFARRGSVDHKKPTVEFFEGRNAIKRILSDTLVCRPTEIVSFSSPEALKVLPAAELETYWRQRTALKIPTRGIVPETPEARSRFTAQKNLKELRRLKFVPLEQYLFEAEIDIYANNVAVMVMELGNEHGFILRSPSVAKNWKAVFELVWALLPRDHARVSE